MQSFHNLTDLKLHEVNELAHLGNKFIPTSTDTNAIKKKVVADIKAWVDSIQVGESHECAQLETFQNAVKTSVLDYMNNTKLYPKHNMSKQARRAKRKIEKNLDLVIGPADKNLGLVAMKWGKYESLTHTALSPEKSGWVACVESPAYIMLDVGEKVKNWHLQYKWNKDKVSVQMQKWNNFAKPYTEIPLFHGTAKIHKPTLALRPIIRSKRWIVTGLSTSIQPILRKLVKKVVKHTGSTHILWNSDSLVKQLHTQPVPQNTVLLTADVESMYENFNWEFVMGEIKFWTKEIWGDTHKTRMISSAVQLILENAYAMFQDQVYKRLEGFNMGDNISVDLAILVPLRRELSLRTQPLTFVFWRYIDDVFALALQEQAQQVQEQLETAWQPQFKFLFIVRLNGRHNLALILLSLRWFVLLLLSQWW